MNWIDLLRDLLCRLYQEWGGDCQQLGADPAAWIKTVVGEYEASGAPGDPDVLLILTELEAHLDMDANSLSDGENGPLRKLIQGIRGDLGAGS